MRIVQLGAVLVTGVLAVAGMGTPGIAATPITSAFLANLQPNVEFLDRSSELAHANGKSARVRDFAQREAAEQSQIVTAVADWIEGDRIMTKAIEAAGGPVMTGRSVALDAPVIQADLPTDLHQGPDTRVALGSKDLDGLQALDGHDFDVAYKVSQLNALSQIAADYADYIASGDDSTLVALAKDQLPKIEHRLALIRKI